MLQQDILIGRCKQKRETSDYDDFYIASQEEAEEQINTAHEVIEAVRKWCAEKENSSTEQHGDA